VPESLLKLKPDTSTSKHNEHRGSAETQHPQSNAEFKLKSVCVTDNNVALR